MKLLFDQNLSFKLAQAFQTDFPGSKHVRDLQLKESSDATVWDHAKTNGYTIVSKDADYSELAASFGIPPKLIWIQLGNCTTREVEIALRGKIIDLKNFLEDKELSTFLLTRTKG
jgi:predicted nuclease of predicted toxin-antitoxin system